MTTELSGKVAVVTGGTKGIGYAVAEALLGLGAKVFVCGRDKSVLRDAISHLSVLGPCEGEVCDMRSESQVRQLIGEAVRVFGRLDILVNNAGMGIFGETVETLNPEDFRATLETNLFGVFYACHYAIPEIKRADGGHIVNVSSLAGQNAHPKMAAYNASKFGLNGFTEALMLEVRHEDIRVSLVCPGSVNTEFGGDSISDEKAWQLQPRDVAASIANILQFPSNANCGKIELRPSKPPR
ncbi:MAG: SDR family oxidoreductase [Pyrinomonadaceae bacterium]